MSFMLAACLFMHVIGDYVLQTPFMATAKGRKYWENEFKQNDIEGRMYKYDYIAILTVHSIAWTFCIMLPIALYTYLWMGKIPEVYFSLFVVNAILHAVIDDQKANKFAINLIEDQILHFVQIAVSIAILVAL